MIPARQLAAIVGVAIGAGIAGDLLLRSVPWGINFPVWIGFCALAASWICARERGGGIWLELRWYMPAIFFAACLAWRDAPQLVFLDVLGTGIALLLPSLRTQVASLRTVAVGPVLLEPVRTAFNVALGPLAAAAQGVDPKGFELDRHAKRAAKIGVGLALAVPVGLVFGGLLSSADPVFDRVVHRLFAWDFARTVSHLLVVVGLAWITVGYLLRLLGYGVFAGAVASSPHPPRLGRVELGIPLGLLVLLFAAFVTIQSRYLFGGAGLVEATIGLSYAEYARRGFIELVVVVFLLVPTLLAADWSLDRDDRFAVRDFRIIAFILLGLTLVIVASAFERMRLYIDNYGMSVDRIYATSAMIWVVLMLVLFALTVLRNARHRFAFGAVVAGFAVLGALNVSSPDSVVARINVARADSGEELDADYLLRLSADAMPLVLKTLRARNAVVTCRGLDRARERLDRRGTGGWRRWNSARASARSALPDVDALAATCAPVD